jgi:hypothetical protein
MTATEEILLGNYRQYSWGTLSNVCSFLISPSPPSPPLKGGEIKKEPPIKGRIVGKERTPGKDSWQRENPREK